MKKEIKPLAFDLPLSKEEIAALQREFLAWYEKYGRSYLPWRKERTPYGTWISEVMLQQTRVDTVIPYYLNFLESFPTIEALSKAPEEEVLKLWQGLGYYSRARNLQKGAKEVVDNWEGQLPTSVKDLITIRGIGPYTAGAISSMAFNQVAPAVDGNTLRVFSRLFAISDDIALPATVKKFGPLIEKVLPKNRSGDFNQALMDLGSSICTPKDPKCESCPLQRFCLAYKENNPTAYPVKSKKAKPRDVYYLALSIEENQKFILEQRESALLKGFWHFPLVEVDKKTYESIQQREKAGFENDFALTEELLKEKFPRYLAENEVVLQKRSLGEISHIFSHLKWHIQLFYGRFLPNQVKEGEKYLFTDLKETSYPLPKAQLKLMALLGQEKTKE